MSYAKVIAEGFAHKIKLEITEKKKIELLTFTVIVPGKDEEQATFIEVRAWGQKAIMFHSILSKGEYVKVEGRLKTKVTEYTNAQGEIKNFHDWGVIAKSVELPHRV